MATFLSLQNDCLASLPSLGEIISFEGDRVKGKSTMNYELMRTKNLNFML